MNQAKEFIEYIINAVKVWVIVYPWQRGIRVRNGKQTKLLKPGIHFKIPYFDSVFIQEVRLRIADMPMQTATTKDLKTITLSGAIGFSIVDIEKLYNTLYHPETSIRSMAMSEVAYLVFSEDAEKINPAQIERVVLDKLKEMDYGVSFDFFRITNFAAVRTYRLIQDQNWGGENIDMCIKK